MKARRSVVGAAICAATVLGVGGSAFAGEYTGNGGVAPGGVKGKSACSFSGLDVSVEVEGAAPFDDDFVGVNFHGVQSYGQFVAYEKTVGPLNLPFPLPSPGQACRGNLPPEE
jgi:hypothetical protein